MTNVIRCFFESKGASGCTSGRVAAGVSRVPDVGGVGGDGGPTSCCRDDTAYSEPGSTVSVSTSTFSGTFRTGVASPVGCGRTGARALLVGELDDGEEREGLLSKRLYHFKRKSLLLTSTPLLR